MKIAALSLLMVGFIGAQAQTPAPAQAPQPVQVAPGTPRIKAPEGAPETPVAIPPAPVAPDTVVAEVDGKKITAAEMDKIIDAFPPANQQALRARPQILSQVFMMRKLEEDAEKAGVDKQSPYKEQLEINRLQVLATAEMTQVGNTIPLSEDEKMKYYKDNPAKFKEVKVRVIYVAFNPNPTKPPADGKKLPTEAEAKAKIEDLAKQIQGGADFGKLARENSDDQASAAKDGDYGTIKSDSPYPQTIKNAVFGLKQGELSAPLREPSGFYLMRAEEISQEPYNDVQVQVIQGARQAKFQEWMKNLQAQYNVKIEDPAYFTPRPATQLQQVH
jgi:parvulin-like peptidyl-prolyl isomerase